MRRSTMIALGIAAFLAGAGAQPALAGYGALAHDDASGKYGLSANEETQSKADDVAMKICGGDKCKVVFRTVAKECGAFGMQQQASALRALYRAYATAEKVPDAQKEAIMTAVEPRPEKEPSADEWDKAVAGLKGKLPT